MKSEASSKRGTESSGRMWALSRRSWRSNRRTPWVWRRSSASKYRSGHRARSSSLNNRSRPNRSRPPLSQSSWTLYKRSCFPTSKKKSTPSTKTRRPQPPPKSSNSKDCPKYKPNCRYLPPKSSNSKNYKSKWRNLLNYSETTLATNLSSLIPQ